MPKTFRVCSFCGLDNYNNSNLSVFRVPDKNRETYNLICEKHFNPEDVIDHGDGRRYRILYIFICNFYSIVLQLLLLCSTYLALHCNNSVFVLHYFKPSIFPRIVSGAIAAGPSTDHQYSKQTTDLPSQGHEGFGEQTQTVILKSAWEELNLNNF